MNDTTPRHANQPKTQGVASPLQTVPGESPAALEAFICYFDLGPERTLKKVSAALDLGESTVRDWSAKFGWGQRILDYRAHLFHTRLAGECSAASQLSLVKVEHEKHRLEQKLARANRLNSTGDVLMDNHLLLNAHKTKLADILRMYQVSDQLAGDAGLDAASERETVSIRTEVEEAIRLAYPKSPTDPIASLPEEGEVII